MESGNNSQGRMAWGLWPQWVLVSTVGFAIGPVLGGEFTRGITFITGFGTAVTVGVAQWLVLRRHLPQASWWLLATFVGIIVGGFLGWMFSIMYLDALCGLAIAIAVCIAQWVFLRRRVRRAFLWLVPGAFFFWIGVELAYGVALPLFSSPVPDPFQGGTMYEFPQNNYAFRAIFGALTGVVTGTLMGPIIAWLVRHPRPTQKAENSL